MRIRDLLAAESIELNGSATDKKDVLNKMVDLMAKSGKINNIETYRAGVFAREEEGTTGTDNQKVSAVSQTGKVFISQHAGSLSYRPG